MTETVIIRDDIVETVFVDDGVPDTVIIGDAPRGLPGRSVTVHWDTAPPLPTDGDVGDLWVVVAP